MACHFIPFEIGTWTKHNEWTVKELWCSNEKGMSEEREAIPDVLSQRIFSRPDQPLLCGLDAHADTQSHSLSPRHTHTHIFKPNNIHEAHRAACKTRARIPSLNKQRLTWAVRNPKGLACHRSPSFFTHCWCRWQGHSLQSIFLACAGYTSLKGAVSSH